jgi:hypothetical protein
MGGIPRRRHALRSSRSAPRGHGLIVAGALIRIVAIATLEKSFRANVAIPASQTVSLIGWSGIARISASRSSSSPLPLCTEPRHTAAHRISIWLPRISCQTCCTATMGIATPGLIGMARKN